MCLESIPDHPDIAAALRTGYPYRRSAAVPCRRCGNPAEVHGDTSGNLCIECALEEWDELTEDEKLDKLGFARFVDADD